MRPIPLLLLLAAPAAAQVSPEPASLVTSFHGPPGGFGALAVFEDHAGGFVDAPGWARDLRLLPIDFVGRTALDELAADRPRHRADVPGASRLLLQGARGTLYRYERIEGGARRFGFLRVTRHGRPVRVFERPGTGPGDATDPFVGRLAVDASGTRMLVATTPAAGGDLVEVGIATGRVFERTPHLGPIAFADAGLWLGDGWGFGVGDAGVLRFDRAAGAVAEPVPMPAPAPTWFSGEAVMSPGRARGLATAGAGPGAQHVYVFGPGGAARPLTRDPAALSGAGFLPESLHGPYMAVTDDGQLGAWRAETATAREARVARIGADPVEVTGDAYFLDTLDEIGQVDVSFDPTRMSMIVGSRNPDGTIEKVDVFDVGLDAAGQPLFTNRTLSSGDSTAPFQSPGTISPEVARRLPTDGTLLVFDEKADRLIAVAPGQSGFTTLRSDVKELQLVEPAGPRWLFALRAESGQKLTSLHTTALDLTGWQQLGPGVDDLEYVDALGDGRGQVLVRALVADTQDHLFRVDAPAGSVTAWQPGPGTYHAPLGFTADGAALFAQGPAAGPVLRRVWPVAGPAFDLRGPTGPGFVLR